MKRISRPIESLIRPGEGQKQQPDGLLLDTDYLVVGSGYGGAVAAMRLAHPGDDTEAERRVVVLERGKEYGLGDFPYGIEDLPSHVRMVRDKGASSGYPEALFNIHIGGDAESDTKKPADGTEPNADRPKNSLITDVLVGSGLGGTSLINANVAEEPLPRIFRKPQWPREYRDQPDILVNEFKQVRQHIGVTTRTKVGDTEFAKYAALARLGKALNQRAEPAHIAITAENGGNALGVKQSPCTDCGNCVTGCNVGAKNTLDRNLLRLAKTRGAQFFTGATVLTVEPCDEGDYRWRINVRLTVTPHAAAAADPVQPEQACAEEVYWLRAKNVILAAGTLGSTEILLRSRAAGLLALSDKLGERFSTNGDGIIMSYGQKTRVGAIAAAEQRNPLKKVGPTITGIIRTDNLSIEEASIPASMGRVFSELVTTGAMLQRLSDRTLPARLQETGQDPLAASMDVAEHCQALLVMGDDGARGRLSLSANESRLEINFPKPVGAPGGLESANDLLKAQDRKWGLDGGQYVPNPMWELFPPAAADALSGEMPAKRMLTVHPLGGCVMADSAAGGVVNHAGEVFNPADPVQPVHKGLYVFDGSIVPTALEVNPFLTIAALAWRNSGLLLAGARESAVTRVDFRYANLGCAPPRWRAWQKPTEFVIQEQLFGQLDALTPWFENELSAVHRKRITEKDGLVMQVVAAESDAETWLDSPGSKSLNATVQLYSNPIPAAAVAVFRSVGINPALLRTLQPFMTLNGTFTILQEERRTWWQDYLGGIKAVFTYVKRRGTSSLSFFSKKDESMREMLCNAPHRAAVFFNIGVLQSRKRLLKYELYHDASNTTLSGSKVVGYSGDLERLWSGLLNLRVSIEEPGAPAVHTRLKVNPEYFMEPGLVAVTASAHLPQSLLFAGGLTAFCARSLFVTNFWEFGGLDYPSAEKQSTKPGELITASSTVPPEFSTLKVPVRAKTGHDPEGEINLLLTRYPQEGEAPPILLLHGLAQGSQIFWLAGIDNLASFFHDAGFDVWMLDYRLSNHVLPQVGDRNWSMDEIAQFDIPMAIDEVYRNTGQQVSIFAHCVGACTLAMATLNTPGLNKKIKAAVSNAIHPWVMPSPANRFRARFGSYCRDRFPDGLLNPIPRKGEGALQNIVDRLAFSLARIGETEEHDHIYFGGSPRGQGICDRMSFLYGTMWNHKNLSHQVHDAFAHMLGPAPLGVYQHMYYYAQLRRLTDKDGENVYLDDTKISHNWGFPILFVHGADSRVFNPHSARRSAHRLKKILYGNPVTSNIAVGYHIFEDYGHMDVIFGKEAYKICFPLYRDFLQTPTDVGDPLNAQDWLERDRARPVVGPMLRAAWIEGDKICLRFWAELNTTSVSNRTRLQVTGGKLVVEGEATTPYPASPTTHRFRLIDVEIADASADIELVLRGDIPNQAPPSGASVVYAEQSWLYRLREKLGSRGRAQASFLVGSCRYPGSLIDNALSDKIYAAMLNHTESSTGAELLFLLGDQIYADALDQVAEASSFKSRYTDRYRRAFGSETSPNFARLVEQLPTHFALDDHEIDDNWSGLLPTCSTQEKNLFEYAVNTAARYIGSGRDRFPVLCSSTAKPFYYALAHPEECDFPVFLTDTRMERKARATQVPAGYKLFEDEQYKELTAWLCSAHEDFPDAPKFIVSGSIIAPLPASYCEEVSTWRHQDGWAGYPQTLENLLSFIVSAGITKVVFVGGDAHLSSVSRLEVRQQGRKQVVWQVVSSGLYAPMPFANARIEDFIWNETHELPTHGPNDLSIWCQNTLLSDHYQQFTRLDASCDQCTVTCFDEMNNVLAKESFSLKSEVIAERAS